MPGTVHAYAVHAVAELTATGAYSGSTWRATRYGQISHEQPLTETELKQLIATEIANGQIFQASDLTFVEFTYTAYPA